MIDNVLVAMDDSEMAREALQYALGAYPEADITVIHVVGEPSGMMGRAMALAVSEDVDEAAEEEAESLLDEATDIAASVDRDISTRVEMGNPVRAILNAAEEYDTVVIGTHGRKLSDNLFVGNVAEKVFKRSPVPVTGVR